MCNYLPNPQLLQQQLWFKFGLNTTTLLELGKNHGLCLQSKVMETNTDDMNQEVLKSNFLVEPGLLRLWDFVAFQHLYIIFPFSHKEQDSRTPTCHLNINTC